MMTPTQAPPRLAPRRRAKPLLGTLVDISVWSDDTPRAEAALRDAFAEIETIHRLMSFHDPASDISRINQAEVGARVDIDARTARVLHVAALLHRDSRQLFDCTIGRELVRHGWLPPTEPGPGSPHADAAWRLERRTVIKQRPCLLDVGGIAKGYAVDRAMALLAARGLPEVLVNAGGDLRHRGAQRVRIDVRDPANPARIALCTRLRNRAMASSATNGLAYGAPRRESALIDGRTRRPLAPNAGASIVAPSCMMADALTKVVLAARDPHHPLLARYGARCVLYRAAPAAVQA